MKTTLATNRALSALLACSVLLCADYARAQDPMVTDRPDQTESAVTIAPGSNQIESGILHTEEDRRGRTFEVTEAFATLVRIGWRERVELRVGFDGWISVPGSDGLGDASIGAKLLIADETEEAPQIAVLIGTSVPIGDDRFTSDDYAPFARLALSKSLGNSLGVGLNLGAEFPENDEVLIYTLVAGYGIDEKNAAFVEVFGNSESSHSFDAGWTHLARPNLQFDVAGGVGITDEAPDWFLGVGVSVRLPK